MPAHGIRQVKMRIAEAGIDPQAQRFHFYGFIVGIQLGSGIEDDFIGIAEERRNVGRRIAYAVGVSLLAEFLAA